MLGADHQATARPAPNQPYQGQAHRHDDLVQNQTRTGESPARAGLLFVDRIAKAATGFFFHVRHCVGTRRPPPLAPRRPPARLRYNMTMQTLSLPPGPAEGFDLGGSDESLARLRRYFAEFGDIYRVFAPARGVYNYVINHPDDIKRVLLSNHRNYTKGEGMDRVKILLGNGIMTSEGDFWRRQRRMMQPSFHRRVIDQFRTLIHDVNDRFAARWAQKSARG